MKILRIYTKLPPFFGGMENHIRYLSQYQKDQGNEVSLFFNQGEKISSKDVQILSWIPLHRIKPQFPGIVFFYMGIILHLLLRKKRVDCIHIHGDWSSLVFARIIKKLTRSKKTIFSFHGSAEHYTKVKKHLLTRLAKQADEVFCTGFNSYMVLKHHPGAIFQPSGIDPVFFEKKTVGKNEKITIITVARLNKVKNLGTVTSIAANFPQYGFVIAGDGPEREAIESLIKIKGLKNISLPGHFDKHALVDLMQSAHVFLLCSYEEGTPTAALEAMACGLPVVCSDAGGLSNLLEHRKHGIIVSNPEDVEGFCNAIQQLADFPDRMESMGRTNREFAKEFSWSSVGKKISEKMLDAKN
jgi:glycosyltransferase involved in cell wall biosynthesis